MFLILLAVACVPTGGRPFTQLSLSVDATPEVIRESDPEATRTVVVGVADHVVASNLLWHTPNTMHEMGYGAELAVQLDLEPLTAGDAVVRVTIDDGMDVPLFDETLVLDQPREVWRDASEALQVCRSGTPCLQAVQVRVTWIDGPEVRARWGADLYAVLPPDLVGDGDISLTTVDGVE